MCQGGHRCDTRQRSSSDRSYQLIASALVHLKLKYNLSCQELNGTGVVKIISVMKDPPNEPGKTCYILTLHKHWSLCVLIYIFPLLVGLPWKNKINKECGDSGKRNLSHSALNQTAGSSSKHEKRQLNQMACNVNILHVTTKKLLGAHIRKVERVTAVNKLDTEVQTG